MTSLESECGSVQQSDSNRDPLNLDVVGNSVLRPDAPEKLTGQAKYINDLVFAGMLYGHVVRSPYARARILSIDTSVAKKMPGVRCVMLAADVPGENIIPLVKMDLPLLADKEVSYVSEGVALVAADTKEQARAAAEAVKVEYEVLEPVLSIDEGLKRNWILCDYKIRKGDVTGPFADPSLDIFEDTYYTSLQEHAYLETNGIIVVPESKGGFVVYGSMQCPFYVQKGVAHVLGMDFQKVRVIQTTTGGGFGGKEDGPSTPASMAAVLSWKTKRPVKLIFSRDEDIDCMTKRHPCKTVYRSAVSKDGKIQAIEVNHYMDGGAFLTLSSIVLWRATLHVSGPYNIPNVKVNAYAVGSNTAPNGAFRGFGQPQVAFAAESHWDEVGRRLGMDPVAFRRINLLSYGGETATGQRMLESCGMTEVANRVLKAVDYDKFQKQPRSTGRYRRGVGVSFTHYGVGLGANGGPLNNASANVVIAVDGSVSIGVGTVEMGQGMVTVLSQIASETLRCPMERIHVAASDTAQVPESGPSVASRTTTMSGNAVHDACRQLRKRLDSVEAAEQLEWNKLISTAWVKGVQLGAQGFALNPHCSFNPENGLGDPYIVYAWSANAADVTVDTYTGSVTVNRLISGHDVGKAINPILVEGQIQGGALQGIGFALVEELKLQDGKVLNNNLSTYILPTAMDAPEIVPIIVEHEFPWGPYGAKGFGEAPLVPVAPAITNAIRDAIGIRMHKLPATPERVWAAIKEQG